MNVLLIDTNFSSIPIYEALVSFGCCVYIVGNNSDDFIARNNSFFIYSDYSDLNSLKMIIKDYDIEYIIPGCNDVSYQICAMLSKENYAKNIDDINKANILLNKNHFREFCSKYNLPAPRSYNLQNVINSKIKGEIIIKPVDAYSGKGITKINAIDIEKIDFAIKKAKNASKNDDFVIEDYVDGQLYSHTAFIIDGKISIDFIVEEYGSVNPFVVDTSFVKKDFCNKTLESIRGNIETISKQLSLSDGLIHTQFIFNGNCYWLIEVTRRCPGDLYSQLIELSTGFNYAEMYASFFIGKKLNLAIYNESDKKIVRHTITQESQGVFNYINYKELFKLERYISISINGDKLNPSPQGRIGILFLDAESEKNKIKIINKLISRKFYDIQFVRLGEKYE